MKSHILVLCLSIIIVSNFFSGCSNNPVSIDGTTQTINGKLVRHNGAPFQGAIVEIQNKITYTDEYGRFILEDILIPYDLIVIHNYQSMNVCKLFNEVRNTSPVVWSGAIPTYFEEPFFEVKLPFVLSQNEIAEIRFANSTYTSRISKISGANDKAYVSFDWENKSLIEGKIYVMIYNQTQSNIYDLKKYSIVEISQRKGDIKNIDINVDQMNDVISETNVAVNLDLPVGLYLDNTTMNFQFGNDIKFSARNNVNVNSFKYELPIVNETDFKIIYEIKSSGGAGQSSGIFELATGGVMNQLKVFLPAKLLTPEMDAPNVDTNTLFTFMNGNLINGTNEAQVFGNNFNLVYYIYPKENNFQIPNLSHHGIFIDDSYSYTWTLSQYDISIDRFLMEHVYNNRHIKHKTVASSRTFYTN